MKSLFEYNGGTYCKQGDYLIPNLILPKSGKTILVFMVNYICIFYKNTVG